MVVCCAAEEARIPHYDWEYQLWLESDKDCKSDYSHKVRSHAHRVKLLEIMS